MRLIRTTQKGAGVAVPTCVLMIVLCSGRPAAQAARPFARSVNPVTDSVRSLLTRHARNLIASAELMPSERYAYQPTSGQLTFGALMAHVVQTNVAICSAFTATTPPLRPEDLKKMSGTDSKDTLVTAIKQSFDYCASGITGLEDAALTDEASMFGRQTGMSRANALLTIVIDWADHYSTAASYLRLNGILPPTAQPKKP